MKISNLIYLFIYLFIYMIDCDLCKLMYVKNVNLYGLFVEYSFDRAYILRVRVSTNQNLHGIMSSNVQKSSSECKSHHQMC